LKYRTAELDVLICYMRAVLMEIAPVGKDYCSHTLVDNGAVKIP